MGANAGVQILICQGTGGISAGAKKVEAEFSRIIAERGIEATVGKRCDVIKTGCRGLCANDVLVDILHPDMGRITYDFVMPEDVAAIVDSHLVQGVPFDKKKAKPYYNN